MTALEQMGEVFQTDVLIVGGGNGGCISALKIKHLDPSVDVTILEQGWHGYKGQSTKAGHGFFMMRPDDDIDAFCKEQVEQNPMGGLYMNDQEYMYGLTQAAYSFVDELEELGGIFAHESDGSLHWHREFPERKNSTINIDLDYIVPYSQGCLKAGVRVLERTYFTDLLTEKGTGRVIGAVGFSLEDSSFVIVKARAVILACNSFNPVITGMFCTPATGLMAAFEAGAQMRNPENTTYCDLGFRNTKNFMYGVHWVIHNRLGENVFQKYGCTDYENVESKLIAGMIEEIRQGNNPLYIDFSKLPQFSETEGEGFNMGMLMPNRLKLDEFIHSTHLEDIDPHANPEISLTTYIMSEGLRVDLDAKTTVKGLWGIGTIGVMGASSGSWVHGDGVAYAARTGLFAAKSVVNDLDILPQGEVDLEQVEFFKNRLYGYRDLKGENLPYVVLHYLDRMVCQPENSFFRTEETIHAVLDELAQIKKDLPNMIYVPQDDAHYLAKAVELRTAIDMFEIMFRAYDMRKESRGYLLRADYPERDDKHYLRWIVVDKTEDGPYLHWERIPFERYKWKPEWWTPDWDPETA